MSKLNRVAGLFAPLSVGALLATACLSVQHTPFESSSGSRANRPVEPAPASVGSYEPNIAPDATEAPIQLERESADADHAIFRVSTLSEGENLQPGRRVTGRYYRANIAGRRPLVIVLPIWGASNQPQRATIRQLRHTESAPEVDVLALDGKLPIVDWEGLWNADSEAAYIETLDRFVDTFSVTVRDIRRLIDWAAVRPEVDPDRIALVGFSASAVVGAVVVAQEPRLAAAALFLGGGRPHQIMASCPRRPARARRHIRQLMGWSTETYEERIEPVLADIDPVRWAGSVDPSEILIIDADDDKCMPEDSRKDLWEAFGRPERVTLPFNHRYAFLTMTPVYGHWATRQIVDFLEEKLFDSRPSESMQTTGDVGTP